MEHERQRRFGLVVLTTLSLLLALFCAPREGECMGGSRVLFISSYHPGFPTFFQQIEGIKSVFSRQSIHFDIEFMDAKRFPDAINRHRFHDMLQYKLAHQPPYDLILTADDDALLFALEYQEELFPGRPMVFFGVNNLDLALHQDQNPLVTGVIEAISMKETLQTIAALHPQAQQIYVLVDTTPSGMGDLATYRDAVRDIPQLHGTELSLGDLSFEELAARLRRISPSVPVLLLSAFQDRSGQVLSFEESLQLIKENLGSPLYHLWQHGLGQGICGGKLISHLDQGRTAAEMAVRILQGTPPSSIKVATESPNRFFFDYNELQRHGIAIGQLPFGSTIINLPHTLYERYKTIVWIVTAVISILIALIATLLVNIFKRRRVEADLREHRDNLEALVCSRTEELAQANSALRESEEASQILSDAAFEGIIITENGKIIDVNAAILNMTGFSKAELIGQDIVSFVDAESREAVREKIVSGDESPYEALGLTKDGRVFSAAVRGRNISYKGRAARVSAVRDLTERKKAEKELRILRGILPICSQCKKIRDDQGYWKQLETYLEKHSQAAFSHSICPDCATKLYGDQDWFQELNNGAKSKE